LRCGLQKAIDRISLPGGHFGPLRGGMAPQSHSHRDLQPLTLGGFLYAYDPPSPAPCLDHEGRRLLRCARDACAIASASLGHARADVRRTRRVLTQLYQPMERSASSEEALFQEGLR
jgi:hypothetical protein